MARVVGYFDAAIHQKPVSDTEKMKYLKSRLTGQGKIALLGMEFGSRSYYHASDILCETYGR